ncbi:DUF6197 family protein [Mycobacteroides abscessus]|uniref:Uncharacterized protein n=1 Tax=Mycobacteroides abscessus subsp. massiliense TaxID=1962118 RepID=A0A1T8V8C6_9MYCO|nr:hypothetical protein [Mycobacteroides abscessus]SIE20290.1 Uncharacterised protein [Mycobacteroides abscessus subsp. abscessus]SKN01210.1 Uncharacterised protein [Mycobacteroides abscessus subsp. massiliense]
MSAPTIPSVADLLRGALAELRRPLDPATGNGWKQSGYGGHNSCKCAAGAIYVAAGALDPGDGRDGLPAAFALLAEAIGSPRGNEGHVIHWNDEPARTFPEVEAAFERAIELAEAGVR